MAAVLASGNRQRASRPVEVPAATRGRVGCWERLVIVTVMPYRRSQREGRRGGEDAEERRE